MKCSTYLLLVPARSMTNILTECFKPEDNRFDVSKTT